ncbi:MAG: hypothetical protein K1X36_14645 [Pyrinomonadaceae bacterium]|nr:hypothetical protein [Pyrinomonadaceae bacterium]
MKKTSLSSQATLIFAIAVITIGTFVSANAQSKTASSEFKRLVDLRNALAKIPPDKLDREPHKSFIKRNQKDITYSDPAGQWFVRSERFWDLSRKYKSQPLADDIAWAAAENPLPGECEGYVNCYIYNALATYGEYLKLYPRGRSSKKALNKIATYLGYITDDIIGKKGNYDGPADSGDRADLAKMIGELRVVLASVSHAERAKVISHLDTIGGAYK